MTEQKLTLVKEEKFGDVLGKIEVTCPACKSTYRLVTDLKKNPAQRNIWHCPCTKAYTFIAGKVISKEKVKPEKKAVKKAKKK